MYRFAFRVRFPGFSLLPTHTLQSVTAAHNLSKRPGCSVFWLLGERDYKQSYKITTSTSLRLSSYVIYISSIGPRHRFGPGYRRRRERAGVGAATLPGSDFRDDPWDPLNRAKIKSCHSGRVGTLWGCRCTMQLHRCTLRVRRTRHYDVCA